MEPSDATSGGFSILAVSGESQPIRVLRAIRKFAELAAGTGVIVRHRPKMAIQAV